MGARGKWTALSLDHLFIICDAQHMPSYSQGVSRALLPWQSNLVLQPLYFNSSVIQCQQDQSPV